MNAPTRLVITGCCGRMGTLLTEEAAKDPHHFTLAGALEHPGHPQIGQPLPAKPDLRISDDLQEVLGGAGLLVEFTTPDATLSNARAAAAAKVPMVIGTTGFTADQLAELKRISRKIPIFWSPNMSIGIVILRRTISSLSKLLFDFGVAEKVQANISEIHHTQKLDKPSGTAKALAEELLKATGWLIRDEEIEAKREGEVIGIHSVTFRAPSENLTLMHEATDRRVFAQGALLVAGNFRTLWKKPGLYSMDDFVSAVEKTKRKR